MTAGLYLRYRVTLKTYGQTGSGIGCFKDLGEAIDHSPGVDNPPGIQTPQTTPSLLTLLRTTRQAKELVGLSFVKRERPVRPRPCGRTTRVHNGRLVGTLVPGPLVLQVDPDRVSSCGFSKQLKFVALPASASVAAQETGM